MKPLIVLALSLLFIASAFAQEPTASAPPCLVGQKLEFRQDDGRLFSRAISREADLCVVEVGGSTKSYYDKDWVLVKVAEPDGRVMTSTALTHPSIGRVWMPFPLDVGKTWKTEERRYSASGRINNYVDQYTVSSRNFQSSQN